MPADKPISGCFRMIPYQLDGQDLLRSQFFAHSLLRHHLLSRIKAAVHKSIPERITTFHMGPKMNKSVTTTMVSEIWLYERNGNLGAGSFTWHSGTISGAVQAAFDWPTLATLDGSDFSECPLFASAAMLPLSPEKKTWRKVTCLRNLANRHPNRWNPRRLLRQCV